MSGSCSAGSTGQTRRGRCVRVPIPGGVALWALLGLLAFAACNYDELPPEEVCADIGYAIATRSYQCGEDSDTANGRYEDFDEGWRCQTDEIESIIDDEGPGAVYACATALGRVSCDDAEEAGDSIDEWLAFEERCADLVTPVGSDASALTEGGAP